MKIGQIYLHKYIKNLSCDVVAFTTRGAKVKQTTGASGRKKAKTITAFYDKIDFGNIWIEKK